MSKRKVTFLKTHGASPLFVPGVGDLGNTLPPVGGKAIDNCEMVEGDNGIIEVSGSVRGIKFNLAIGSGNIAHYLFVKDEA